MKEINIGWSSNSSLPKFPDYCVVCMESAAQYINPTYSWITLSVPYCTEHIDKAKNVHDFYREYMEEDGPIVKIANWLGWAVGIIAFMAVLSTGDSEKETMELLAALVVGAIAKAIIHYGLAGLYFATIIRFKAKRRGLVLSECDRFLGLNLHISQGQQGQQLNLQFVNDEYGNLFEAELKKQHVKQSDNSPNS